MMESRFSQNKPEEQLALPSREQLEWQDLELGMFCHFGINTFAIRSGEKAMIHLRSSIRFIWMPTNGLVQPKKLDSVILY